MFVSVRVSTFGMPDGYQRLLDRCVEVFIADDRVVALFAAGSVGRGTADASSDLDLVAALVDQAAVEDVCAGWETLIEEVTPTVYRRLLGTQIVTVVTPSWERLDITFMPAAATGLLTSGPATVLFDHGQTQPPISSAASSDGRG